MNNRFKRAAYLLAGVTIWLGLPATGRPQPAVPTAAEKLLERAIAHHDPQGLWGEVALRLSFEETRADGTKRQTRVILDPRQERFEWWSQRGDDLLQGSLLAGRCSVTLNGSTEFSDTERDAYSLGCDRVTLYRDYYSYLWGLPMKLYDPGTRIHPELQETEFNGQKVHGIRVTYDEQVGSDTWYFYFEPEKARLVGYRFFHDEAANDGEYILLEDEFEAEGLRLPESRTWYTNTADRLLGTDTLVALETIKTHR